MLDVSVIIPTYKPQDYLWQCLVSLKNQTLPKNQFEIILILNGCDDPYHSQISRFVEENMPDVDVKFIQTDVPGVSNARNIGIDNARGRYITFLDDDDYLSECFLEKMLPIAEKGIIPMSNMTSFSDADNSVQPYYITEAFKRLYNKGAVSPLAARSYLSVCVAKLLPMEIIKNQHFNTNFKMAEDSIFMFSLSKDINKMECSDKDAIYYRRIRERSATSVLYSRKKKIINSLKPITQYFKIYLSSPFKYNVVLLMTRVMGAFRKLFIKGNI